VRSRAPRFSIRLVARRPPAHDDDAPLLATIRTPRPAAGAPFQRFRAEDFGSYKTELNGEEDDQAGVSPTMALSIFLSHSLATDTRLRKSYTAANFQLVGLILAVSKPVLQQLCHTWSSRGCADHREGWKWPGKCRQAHSPFRTTAFRAARSVAPAFRSPHQALAASMLRRDVCAIRVNTLQSTSERRPPRPPV
jgi:hypothetical protein